MKSRTCLGLLLIAALLAGAAGGNSQAAMPLASSEAVLADGQFVFGPNVSEADVAALTRAGSPWADKGGALLAQADLFSVNPLVLATVLHILSPGGEGDEGRMHDVAAVLRAAFSQYRAGGKRDVDAGQAPNAATYAVGVALAGGGAGPAVTAPEGRLREFARAYRRLFPQSDPLDASNVIAPAGPPPADMLQLPFPVGESWVFNGPHHYLGDSLGGGQRPMSSMDFGITGSCSAPPDLWAAAAAGGTVQAKRSEYGLRLDHGNGWQTAYYHLRDIWTRFAPGDWVDRNAALGRISCLHDPEGFADSPHVHFSLLYNGEYVDIAQPTPGGGHTALSGYQVYEGGAYYGSLARESTIPAYSPVYNDGGARSAAGLSFTVRLENPQGVGGFSHSRPVAVVVQQPGSGQVLLGPRVVTTDAGGYYGGLSLDGLQPGSYDVCAKARSYLGQCAHGVPISPGSSVSIDFSQGGSTPARLGDIDPYGQDNQDNTIDYERIRTECMAHCGAPYPEFDLNQDGIFDSQDASLVGYRVAHDFRGEGNFGLPFPGGLSYSPLGSGRIAIQPDSGSGYVGDVIAVSIVLDSGGDSVTAADAKVYYDPGLFEVLDEDGATPGVQIAKGSIFGSVYRNTVDTDNGVIWFSAGYGTWSGTGTLATLRLRVLAATPPAAHTLLLPSVVAGDSTDSNSPQYNSAWDVITGSSPGAFVLYGAPGRAAPAITLSPAAGSALNQTLLHLTAQVDDPYNQETCVTFGVYAPSGASAAAQDCVGSDGWGALLDTSAIADQAWVTARASVSLRATSGEWTAESTGLTLDRTAPHVAGVTLDPPMPMPGDLVQVGVTVQDALAPQVWTELWVNTAADGSELGDWLLLGEDWLAPPSPEPPALTWDTAGLEPGAHLLAVTVRDPAGNWGRWTRLVMLGAWPGATRVYLPLVLDRVAPARVLAVCGDPADGEVGRVDCPTWDACRAGAEGNWLLTTYPQATAGATLGGGAYNVKRIFLFFDTSALPSGAAVTAAKLRLYAGPYQTGNTRVHVLESSAGRPLSVADFGRLTWLSGGSAVAVPNTWLSVPLSGDALDWIVPGGMTRLAVVDDLDLWGAAPGEPNNVLLSLAEDGDKRPCLEIEYH